MQSLAQPEQLDTREKRAIALYLERGEAIEHMGGPIYTVPSQDGERRYLVEYGALEKCSCPDYLYRHETCVHLYALAVAIAKKCFVHPELAAGDPFLAADASRPCACTDGWVFVGYTNEFGEEREASYRCRSEACSMSERR